MQCSTKNDHCRKSCCSRIENLGVTANGQKIIHDVNLHIHCGELTILIGPNGSGKTTLLRAMVGELPHSGVLDYHGVNKDNSYKLRIGYVPQRIQNDPGNSMTVNDLFQVSLSKQPAWLFRDKKSREKAILMLDQMNATYLLDRKLSVLSGGEVQRVLVALAMTPVPDLLLLDEPVSGVDHRGLALFYNAISKLRHLHDLSIVMVSHDLALSSQYADRMVLINKTIICEGTPGEVLKNTQTKLLMGYGIDDSKESDGPWNHHAE